MVAKTSPAIKELRNATKRFFLDYVDTAALMSSLSTSPEETLACLQADPTAWGKIRPCLTKSLRKRNFLRLLAACRAYADDVQPPIKILQR